MRLVRSVKMREISSVRIYNRAVFRFEFDLFAKRDQSVEPHEAMLDQPYLVKLPELISLTRS